MKNIKVLIAIVALIFCNAHAGTAELLKKMQGPGFEIYNKAPQAISVAVVVDGKLSTADIVSNKKYAQDVDLNKTIRLGIYNKQTKGISTSFMTGAITPQPDAIYDLTGSGTKYVTFTPSKSPSLYPQTGTLMGLSGKSDSGYPLNKNLSQSQIVPKK